MIDIEQRISEARSRLADIAPASIQRRVVPINGIEVRDSTSGFTVTGHAAVFDALSDDLGGFREKINRGAFKNRLDDDVRFLVNHNPDLLLARTGNDTLRMTEDPTGLHIEADIAPTTAGNDLRILLERGDMDQMSFAFSMHGEGKDSYSVDEESDMLIRTIHRFGQLYDASAVTYPAYPQTDVQANSLRAAVLDSPDLHQVSPPKEQEDRATVEEPDSEAEGDLRVTPDLAYRQRRLRMRERLLA